LEFASSGGLFKSNPLKAVMECIKQQPET